MNAETDFNAFDYVLACPKCGNRDRDDIAANGYASHSDQFEATCCRCGWTWRPVVDHDFASVVIAHGAARLPHQGACPQCRSLKLCNYCGADMPKQIDRCTNGRCIRCHRNVCTAGGATSSGHGFGRVGSDWRTR